MKTAQQAENFDKFNAFLTAVQQVNACPEDMVAARRRERTETVLQESFYLPSRYDRMPQVARFGRDFSTDNFSIENVRQRVLQGNDPFGDALARQSRSGLVEIGVRTASTGALASEDFPEAYAALGGVLKAIGTNIRLKENAEDTPETPSEFAAFGMQLISRQLWEDYTRLNKIRLSDLPPSIIRNNIRSALKVVGHPYSIFGHLALSRPAYRLIAR